MHTTSRTLVALIMLLSASLSSGQTPGKEAEAINKELQQLKLIQDSLSSQLEEVKFRALRNNLESLGIPETNPNEEIIYHTAFALVYDESHEQAKWVAHMILPDVATGTEGRTNDFRPDPLIKTGSAVDEDYALKYKTSDGKTKTEGFGFDRGHLAPSADFRYSKKALSESYFYSNMAPQTPGLNRGRWSDLEDAMRSYCVRENTPLFIVTGGVLNEQLPVLDKGRNKVSIPQYYYKVALDTEHGRAIGFIMPNEKCEHPLSYYVCTIDSVEKLTGLNFFYKFDDATEALFEASYDTNRWIQSSAKAGAEPLSPTSLPKNTFNTEQAAFYANKRDEITVCGKVVSTKLSSKGNIFLNLDKPFPQQIFTVTIFKDQVANFSYAPHELLKDKTICVKGMVTTDGNGIPGMIIKNESAVEIMD